jgi:hypothetical protein
MRLLTFLLKPKIYFSLAFLSLLPPLYMIFFVLPQQYSPTPVVPLNSLTVSKAKNLFIPQKVYAAGIDFTKYTQSPFNLPTPSGESDIKYESDTLTRANTLGGYVQKHLSYLQGKFSSHPEYIDPFAAVIWDVAIEGTGADPYDWNCQDVQGSSNNVNNGCPNGYSSGGWQVNGIQVSQAASHLAADFQEVYGKTDGATVKSVGDRIISGSSDPKITNPSSFPATDLQTIISANTTESRQLMAILLMDPELGAVAISQEIAGDIGSTGNWVSAMLGWPGSYYSDNMQNFSNRAKYLADNYTGSVTGGGTTGTGGGSYSLDLVLKPTEKDTYVLNKATAQALGGGGGSGTGQGAPPGSVDGQCTPTGTYPADPGGELQSKYKISTDGFGADGIKMIYELATCVSTSKFPTLLGGTSTTVHNAISPSLGSIGMDCDATCNVWIPEGTNAFKFILTHEFGHVLYYTNPRETMHVSEFEDSWNKEGGLSPYSGPYYGGQGGCPTKGAVEDYAEMVAYYLNPTMGGKTGACDSRDNPKNSLFEDTHFPLHLEVAKQVL